MESFDVIVIDPPFITSEVWMKYAATAHKLIKKKDGKYILTTILENAPLLKEQFEASPTVSQALQLLLNSKRNTLFLFSYLFRSFNHPYQRWYINICYIPIILLTALQLKILKFQNNIIIAFISFIT